jgi:hypothetical protein
VHQQAGLDGEVGDDLTVAPAVDPARRVEVDRGRCGGDRQPLADQRLADVGVRGQGRSQRTTSSISPLSTS